MKIIKNILIWSFILFASLYLFFAFIFPVVINKNFSDGNFQYRNAYINYKGLKIKTFPHIHLQIQNIEINDNQGNIISENNLYYQIPYYGEEIQNHQGKDFQITNPGTKSFTRSFYDWRSLFKVDRRAFCENGAWRGKQSE